MDMTFAPRKLLVASVAALLGVALTGCGSAGKPVAHAARTPSAASPAADPPDPQVDCQDGRAAWPVSAMTGGTLGSESSELVPALRAFARSAGIDAPPAFQDGQVRDSDWFVLGRDGEFAAVATGPWSTAGPGKGAQVVYLDRKGSGWDVTGWGDCQLSPLLTEDNTQWVEVEGVNGSRDTAEPTLRVHERGCTSGRDPRPYLHAPKVVETADSVTVSWASDEISGAADCIGSPGTPVAVTLDAPLGGRTLYDGSTYPATKVG